MRGRMSPALVVSFLFLGFLVATGASGARREQPLEPRRKQLIESIEQRQASVDRLEAQARGLQSDLADARDSAADRNQLDGKMANRVDRLAAQAGTSALAGPGLVVELDDSSQTPPEGDDSAAYRIYDADIQHVVNALFASGAEAVAVNGNRVVATTPIRLAGDTIVVNFRPLDSPYEIVAIGADRDDFEATLIAKQFDRWSELFGLHFELRSSDDLSVPPFVGRLRLQYAAPEEG